MAKGKEICDCPIIVTKFLTIREAIVMMIQKNLRRIIIRSYFKLVVNSINDKAWVHKDIINLADDIRILTSSFLDIK